MWQIKTSSKTPQTLCMFEVSQLDDRVVFEKRSNFDQIGRSKRLKFRYYNGCCCSISQPKTFRIFYDRPRNKCTHLQKVSGSLSVNYVCMFAYVCSSLQLRYYLNCIITVCRYFVHRHDIMETCENQIFKVREWSQLVWCCMAVLCDFQMALQCSSG